ncbi:MAG: FKBP-type peptidyl-prolyl cis-trans isomerase [Planctomycetes bacterium]|nr:FKBP-type peptidyl-prolyl cis-trans isomerase [Planctomycetota bacterium]
MRIWDFGFRALRELKQSLAPQSAQQRRKRRTRLAFESLEPRYALAGLAGSVASVVNGHTYALPEVLISIVGRDSQNAIVSSSSVRTGAGGTYSFTGLPAGTYTITETQPTGIIDGASVAGSAGGTAGSNTISGIVLGAAINGTGYNFNEKGPGVISVNMFLSSTPLTGPFLASLSGSTATNPPAVAVTSGTTPINSSNVTNLSASGTGQAGASVSVVVTDGTKTSAARTATVAANGTWTVSGLNANALANGVVTYRATITNSAGGTATSTLSASKDTTAPLVDILAATNPVNMANKTSVSANGTAQVGSTVTVVVTDGTTTTAAVNATLAANGTWSVSGINVSALKDGTITYRATMTDSANQTFTDTFTATKTTVLITTVTNPITSANQTSTTASGTGQANANISVTATDGTITTPAKTTTVAANGTWSVAGIDVTGFVNGTITYTANASDGLSNTATSTLTSTKTNPASTPFATDDSYNLAIGATLTTTAANGVLANDTDGATNAILVSGPSHGTLTLNPNGTFSYTQTTYGFDQFTYQVTNSSAQTDQATVTIQVPGLPPLPAGAVLTTTASGLQYYDFTVGTGASPSATSTVTVDYVGYLPTGTVFDSNNNINFSLAGVVEGFSEGVQGMKVGGVRRLIIPPDLGYGPGGNPGAGIGGTDTIVFDVTLDAIV